MGGVSALRIPGADPGTSENAVTGGVAIDRGTAEQADDPQRWRPVLDALVTDGVLSAPVTRSRVTSGPMMARIAVSSAAGEHLVLDVSRNTSVVPPACGGPAMDRLVRATARTDSAGAAPVAAEHVGTQSVSAWFHRTPWPAAMLAEVVTGAVAARLPEPAVFAGLGALLARLHASDLPVEHRMAPPLQRVVDGVDNLTADQHDTALRILGASDPAVPVHGQPALGHMLVPVEPTDVAPTAVLTGWSDRLGSSAALDLGHLLGDITEIAVLVHVSDRMQARWLRARIADVRDGYCAAADPRALGGTFWDRVADGALLRVLDHRATLCRLLGPGAPPVRLADRVAAHLTSSTFREKGFRP